MALNTEQKKILVEAKVKLKIMGQVSRLEKEISSLEKKLEAKESKVSELINNLDDQNNPDKKNSLKSKEENGKSMDPLA